MSASRPPERGKNTGTYLALLALLVVAGLLVGLSAMVLPQIFGLLLVVFGFFFFAAFHYLTWGWWMSRVPPADDEDDE